MRASLYLGLLAIVSATAFAAGKQSAAVESLHALNDRFNRSVIAGDADDLVGLYADDALWIEQGKPVVRGLNAPRQLFEFVTTNQGVVTHTIDDLFVADDSSLAVMIGSVEAKVDAVGMDATGTYLFVLKPDGNSWKISTDMWHQHLKAPDTQ